MNQLTTKNAKNHYHKESAYHADSNKRHCLSLADLQTIKMSNQNDSNQNAPPIKYFAVRMLKIVASVGVQSIRPTLRAPEPNYPNMKIMCKQNIVLDQTAPLGAV